MLVENAFLWLLCLLLSGNPLFASFRAELLLLFRAFSASFSFFSSAGPGLQKKKKKKKSAEILRSGQSHHVDLSG